MTPPRSLLLLSQVGGEPLRGVNHRRGRGPFEKKKRALGRIGPCVVV